MPGSSVASRHSVGLIPDASLQATSLARPALAKSLRGWAVLPNPFATARGSAARAQWVTHFTGISFPKAALNTTLVYDSATSCPFGETFALGRLSSMTGASGRAR